jgi:lysozyme family protein
VKSDDSRSANDGSRYPGEFLLAVDRVLVHEGGESNAPADRGGETKFGISHRQYRDLVISRLTREQAIAIYFRDWWQRYHFGALPSQAGAKVFDLAVNMGTEAAIRCLQRALRACTKDVGEDGVLGSETLEAAHSANSEALTAALRSEAAGHYRLIAHASVKTGTAENPFLKGWLNRAYE